MSFETLIEAIVRLFPTLKDDYLDLSDRLCCVLELLDSLDDSDFEKLLKAKHYDISYREVLTRYHHLSQQALNYAVEKGEVIPIHYEEGVLTFGVKFEGDLAILVIGKCLEEKERKKKTLEAVIEQ